MAIPLVEAPPSELTAAERRMLAVQYRLMAATAFTVNASAVLIELAERYAGTVADEPS